LWGIIQAEEQIQRIKDIVDPAERAKVEEAEFNYLVSANSI
jgi:hypothetical protein